MLKLDHQEAQRILHGKKTTWRLYDDKDLSVNDTVQLIDKVVADDPVSWVSVGRAQITKILQKQLGELTQAEYEQEGYKSLKEMVDAYGDFYNREILYTTPIKIVHFTFIGNGENSDIKSTTLHEAKVFADGGSRGNPGPSASGFVILDMNDQVVVKKGTYLGITTNNQAEYQAVKLALEEARKRQIRSLHIYLDSLLVVNQMSGIYKVRNRDLWPIHAAIKELVGGFKKVVFTHVPRELNKLADSVVNVAIDEALHRESKRFLFA